MKKAVGEAGPRVSGDRRALLDDVGVAARVGARLREAREEAEPVQEDEIIDDAGRLLVEERASLDQSLRLRNEPRMSSQLALEK